MFIGSQAEGAKDLGIDEAIQMEAQGLSREEIFTNTGWFRQVESDSKWRFETDDSTLEFSEEMNSFLSGSGGQEILLMDAFKPNPILEQYHDFWNVVITPIIQDDSTIRSGGYKASNQCRFNTNSGFVELHVSLDVTKEQFKKSLLHEVQHFIQQKEDFAVGGNATMFRELDLLKEKRRVSLLKINNLLRENPEFAKGLAQRFQTLIELHSYGEGNDLDWDAVPDEIADRYFDELDAFEEMYPKLSSEYFELADEAENQEYRGTEGYRYIDSITQYLHLAGEIEAYQVADRAYLTNTERKASIPVFIPHFNEKVVSIKPIVHFQNDVDQVIENAWKDEMLSRNTTVNDVSVYADYFSRSSFSKFAQFDELVKSVNSSFLVMMADLSKDLPDDNPLVKDFNIVTAWLGTTPRQFRNLDYVSRREYEHRFNEGFLSYVSEPTTNVQMKGVFDTVTKWLRLIAEKFTGALTDIDVTPEMMSVYNNLFGNSDGVNPHSDFQTKLRTSINDAMDLTVDAQLSFAAVVDAGYDAVAERSGVPRDTLEKKYSMEFNKRTILKAPKKDSNGVIRIPRSMSF
ncbi:LPD23 domain-containing protein [Vibrio sp. D431a]|uniref:LPD23 domain-containing protein n=1 Tax=Vibrio sp. D431a TaxID=2837388 RepID=UPI0025552879|nr:LPD23 domain-containing protein [Vibrio sp. D431a]MDK9789894.1 hypothetical protein [Vibrio sp. D431a]